MKIKLTPDLSYIIGLWRKSRCPEGIGVEGDREVVLVFSQEVLEKQLTTSDKLLTGDEKVFFYHSAYRKFFQQVEAEQLDRFKYINEYAASYLAGMFDAAGGIDERGVVSIYRSTRQDEMMLLRLGFQSRRRGERLIIERPLIFLAFIKNYVKVKKGDRAFSLVKAEQMQPRPAAKSKTASAPKKPASVAAVMEAGDDKKALADPITSEPP